MRTLLIKKRVRIPAWEGGVAEAEAEAEREEWYVMLLVVERGRSGLRDGEKGRG